VTLSGRSSFPLGNLAYVLAMAGERAEAERVLLELEELGRQRDVPANLFATAEIALGEIDRAFAHLEKALQEREWFMILLRVDPRLDSIRADPRFDGLLRGTGLVK
jgi:Flp pilus assembly protein TadD